MEKTGTKELVVAVAVGPAVGAAVAFAGAAAAVVADAVALAVAVAAVGAAAAAVAAASGVAVAVVNAKLGRIRVLTCAGTCVVAPTASFTVTSHVTKTAYHPMGFGIPFVSATSYASIAVACGARITGSGGGISVTGMMSGSSTA
jgi:hypothetical protein